MINHLHGAFTYQQLLDDGLSKKTIAARVRNEELIRIRHGLYRHSMSPQGELQLMSIGLLAVGGRGLATSACCLRLQGFTVNARLHTADIVVPYGTEAPDDVKWVEYRRSSHLDVISPVEIDDLSCVPAWWAFGDLAYDVVDPALAETIAKAVGANQITLDELEAALERRGNFPGRKRLRCVLAALRSDLPFSKAERDAARGLRDAGLDVRLQHEVTVDGGRTYRLDMVIEDLKINIEIDGPHHWLPMQAAADRQRDRLLRQLDWLVERFSVYEIDKDPDAFVAEVLRIVQRRREALADRKAA